MVLTNLLKQSAKALPDKPALIMRMGYRTVRLSYQEVYDLAKKIACFLEKQGVKKGAKVILLAPNSPYWICLFWGTLLRGAVLVPLNTQSTPEMVRRIADQTDAKIIFKSLHINQNFPSGIKVFDIELLKEYVADATCPHFKKADVHENDLVEIMYTSGTTGDPKGVGLTHKNLYSNAKTVSQLIPLRSRDKFLSILPLSHIFEQMAGFLIPFKKGCTIVYTHSPAAIVDLMNEHGITIMAAVPEFLQILMNKMEVKAKTKGKIRAFRKLLAISSKIQLKPMQRLLCRSVLRKLGGKLRAVASGGAPLDPELEQKWNALGIYLLQGYGLTETSPIISTNNFWSRQVGSVGKTIPDIKVKIASDGEILVKGPNVFGGYFKNKEKTDAAFTKDGWFKTDDLGEIGLDEFLRIKGRKKYMILGPGGQNVYPEDIEFELNRIFGVKDSCVVGLEKESGRIEIHAILLLEPETGKKPAKIIETANKNLASYQQIMDWSVWQEEDFPRSLTRKVKKGEVLKWLRSQKEKKVSKKHEAKSPLIHLLADITGTDSSHITQKTSMSHLNLDSLLRIELVARIGEKFGVMVEESKIIGSTTVSDLEKIIKTAQPLKERRFSDTAISWWAKLIRFLLQTLIVFPFIRIFVKLKVEGKENLKNLPLPAVFMPNHLSYVDSAVVPMALPFRIRRKLSFAAAVDVLYEEYKWIAWLVQVCFNSFRFPRKETESIQYGLEYVGRRLDQGYSVVIYPEGQMSKSKKLLPLKRGTGLVATEMDVPVIPVKIINTPYVVPYAKIWPRRRGKVTVKFGKPMKFSQRDSMIEVTEKIQKIIKSL